LTSNPELENSLDPKETFDHCCFLPLYVFCGDQLLVGYLRPANIDGPRHGWAIFEPLVRRLRREWPENRRPAHRRGSGRRDLGTAKHGVAGNDRLNKWRRPKLIVPARGAQD
jgi:hypothetical protein